MMPRGEEELEVVRICREDKAAMSAMRREGRHQRTAEPLQGFVGERWEKGVERGLGGGFK